MKLQEHLCCVSNGVCQLTNTNNRARIDTHLPNPEWDECQVDTNRLKARDGSTGRYNHQKPGCRHVPGDGNGFATKNTAEHAEDRRELFIQVMISTLMQIKYVDINTLADILEQKCHIRGGRKLIAISQMIK